MTFDLNWCIQCRKSPCGCNQTINQALSEIEQIPYYVCEEPHDVEPQTCGFRGIEFCACDHQPEDHPIRNPAAPRYHTDMIACLRVAKVLGLMVIFNFIDNRVSIRKCIGEGAIKIDITDHLTHDLAHILYEYTQKRRSTAYEPTGE